MTRSHGDQQDWIVLPVTHRIDAAGFAPMSLPPQSINFPGFMMPFGSST